MKNAQLIANLLNAHGIETQATSRSLRLNNVLVCKSNPALTLLPYVVLAADCYHHYHTLFGAIHGACIYAYACVDDNVYEEKHGILNKLQAEIDALECTND